MAYLVAVTACVSGVAHTYMAAERLEKLCLLEKWGVSIETQGALGTENRFSGRGYPPGGCCAVNYGYRACRC
ncbi:fructose-like specific PTS system EIIB component 3 [Escherichia coli]|uniref:protein-N(pi)-phosphohistidine--D-fructose phosphotransferase n=1 Tax=Escherichia coli TaxID=562 RepID=A0A447Y4V4_ECOLX|nr:fructose-like specific PTS system EIIB component 3 [Escherichia coli]